jgi:phage terminase Nu1 subunit (DNA packaging protein)
VKKKPRKPRKLADVGTVAEALHLDARRIQQLVAEGLPKEARGKYDSLKCLRWYVRYLQEKLARSFEGHGGAGDATGLTDQRLRGMKATTELREMELALKKGLTVNVADVQAAWSELVLMTKARMMSIPPRLAVEVMGETSRVMIQAKIEKAIKDSLNQLADDGTNYPPRK